MHEMELRLQTKNPEQVKASLEPDINNNSTTQTEIKVDKAKSLIVISIRSEKLSHMKAIMNSYMGIIAMVNEADEKIK